MYWYQYCLGQFLNEPRLEWELMRIVDPRAPRLTSDCSARGSTVKREADKPRDLIVLEAPSNTYRGVSLIHDTRPQANAPVHRRVCPRGPNYLRPAQLGCLWEATWASGLAWQER